MSGIETAAARRRRDRFAGPLFALPALLGLTLFVATPFVLAVAFSLTDLRLGSPLAVRWVGIEQYRRVLTDPTFLRALANNATFAATVVPLQTLLALALALLLDRGLPATGFFRALFFLPVVFPMALVAVIWKLLYAPGPEGPINALLATVSFGAWRATDFLHDPGTALAAIIVLSIWQGVGLQMVILLAGLQSIPRATFEAAAIDRAGRLARFFHITLPQLRGPLLFTALVTTVLAFRLFDQVQILTRGGPASATTTVVFEAVRAVFERQQVARASAMTVVFFTVVFAVTVVQRLLVRPGGTAQP